jgi:hypothetical protein
MEQRERCGVGTLERNRFIRFSKSCRRSRFLWKPPLDDESQCRLRRFEIGGGSLLKQRADVDRILRAAVVVSGKNFERQELGDSRNGKLKAREHLDHCRPLDNLGLNTRRREEKIENDPSVSRSRRSSSRDMTLSKDPSCSASFSKRLRRLKSSIAITIASRLVLARVWRMTSSNEACACVFLGDDTTRFDVCQTSVNVPQKVELLDQGLKAGDIYQNSRSLSLLSEDDRAPRLLDLPEESLTSKRKLGGGMDVLGHVERNSRHQYLRHLR